jgi:coenzyme F420-reducing hydrogenase beta subunit
MKEDERGFSYPHKLLANCRNCGLCYSVCPFKNTEKYLNVKPDNCYALTTNDPVVRYNSTSGGAFTAIIDTFCDNNTVIIGAEMCEDLVVRHTIAYSKDDTKKFQKSKYVQSDINGTYISTKGLLLEGKKVLFTGTPCQIAGLKGFLKESGGSIDKYCDNLLTADVVCHGVPSGKFFKKYIDTLEHKYKKKIKHYDFRAKMEKTLFGEAITFIDNVRIINSEEKNLYRRIYKERIAFMPSCYNCKFARPERSGDITIADFWSINLYTESFDLSKGVSLVIVNNQKGQEIFNKFNDVQIFKTSYQNAKNSCLSSPSPKNENYEKFMDLVFVDFNKAIKKYYGTNYLKKMIPKPLKTCIKKIMGINAKRSFF